jgi:hypothetical protein
VRSLLRSVRGLRALLRASARRAAIFVCGRRVMALYLVSGRCRCRRCHHLTYESQYQDAERRAMRRADKARARWAIAAVV